MTSNTIERDIEIEAAIEIVWRTITQPELIRTWFANDVDIAAEPGAVGSLTFIADSDEPIVVGITVVSAQRPYRFSYRWMYPPGQVALANNSTLVTFTLIEVGPERTRLRVVESGLDHMDMTDDDRQTFLEEHRHGWQVQGDRLRNLFTAEPLSSP